MLLQENIVTIAKFKSRIHLLTDLIRTALAEGSSATLDESPRSEEQRVFSSLPGERMDLDNDRVPTDENHDPGHVGDVGGDRHGLRQDSQDRMDIHQVPENGLWI